MSSSRVQALQPGDPSQLGHYQLLGRIGAGGMGRVYLGRSVSGRLVAVKTLLTEEEAGQFDRRRFAREVALARRVNGVFTVSVVDGDAEAVVPWMATEYVPAPSLADLVQRAGALPSDAVRWLAAGMAEALTDLHRAGIVHRDVKPGNTLLPLTGPRLLDFGISHATDLTRTTLTLGTIAFSSPEQARGEQSTAASDVYSLGATLFFLAVGRPPYAADADALRLLAHVQRGELDLTGLPGELDTLIRPCLALAPEARPSPADLLSAAALVPLLGAGSLPPAWTAMISDHSGRGAPEPIPAAVPVADSAESFHRAVTSTAPPPVPGPPRTGTSAPPVPAPPRTDPPVLPVPVPDPPQAGGVRRRGFRGRILAWSAAVTVLLASLGFGGYKVYWNNSDEGQSYAAVRDFKIGDCLRDYRLVVEKADCSSAEAHYIAYDRVEGGTWCPEQRQNSGLREEGDLFVGTIELCVKRNIHVGECVYAPRFPDSGRMDSGFLLEDPAMCDPGYLEIVKAIPLEGGASDPSLVCGGVGPIHSIHEGTVYCLKRIARAGAS